MNGFNSKLSAKQNIVEEKLLNQQVKSIVWATGLGMILLSGCETGTTTWNAHTSRVVGYNTQASTWQNGSVANTTQVAAPTLKRTYYIDLVISGVRDYLNGKNLDLDMNRIYANPSLYYMFEQDPATWNVGPLLYTLDGSDPLLNPTYLALNPELFNPQLPARETKNVGIIEYYDE